ncbi:uncharacterized protein LOC126554901, partial [Aphis gossypii]|uniref:uncharacterized protein LOC126554901 n=1 Tax=Aphis gossypii TaxID=80765 RepID=UPI002158CF3F
IKLILDNYSKKKSLGLITSGHFKKILNLEKNKTPKIQLQFNSTTNLPDVQSNIEIDYTVIDTQSLSFPNIVSCEVQSSSNSHLSTINSNSSLKISYDTHLPHLKQKTNISVKDKLRQWVIKHKISHNATNSLLGILKCEGLNVPIDVRTLMKTPTKPQEVIIMGHGSYYIHCGIKNMLVPILKKYFNMINCEEDLKLGINVDGLPISNSSKSQLWPILISLINCQPINKYVLPVEIFHGSTKPTSIHEFFQPFVDDLCEILQNGISVNNRLFKFKVGHIICDTPAKNCLLNVRAYFGCSSCTQEGEYIQHRMTFPEIDAPLRTNDSFRNKVHEEYHKGDNPLEFLPIDIVNDVCLDYMHLLCIGIIKRLITFWVKGKKDVRLTEEDTLSVSKNILALRPYVPSEFSRKPRVLEDINYWKATELRNIIIILESTKVNVLQQRPECSTSVYSNEKSGSTNVKDVNIFQRNPEYSELSVSTNEQPKKTAPHPDDPINALPSNRLEFQARITRGPFQPNFDTFPRTQCGNYSRSFHKKYYSEFKWLEYSPTTDSAFCFACRCFSSSNLNVGQKETAFTTKGFNTWKNISESLKKHQKSKSHFHSFTSLSNFLIKKPIDVILDETKEKALSKRQIERQGNRSVIHRLIDITILLAKTGKPFRAQTDDRILPAGGGVSAVRSIIPPVSTGRRINRRQSGLRRKIVLSHLYQDLLTTNLVSGVGSSHQTKYIWPFSTRKHVQVSSLRPLNEPLFRIDFKEHSKSIQPAFKEHSTSIQRAFKEHSTSIQRAF